MAMKKDVIIRARLVSIEADPNEYKPFKHTLAFDKVFVQIEVHPDDVISVKKGGGVTLNLSGLEALIDADAALSYRLHLRQVTRVRKSV